MRCHEGYPVAPLQVVGGSNGKRGTEITFLPNPKIFIATSFDFAVLDQRFRMLASLGANVTLVLIDKRGVDRKEVVIDLVAARRSNQSSMTFSRVAENDGDPSDGPGEGIDQQLIDREQSEGEYRPVRQCGPKGRERQSARLGRQQCG